AGATLLSWVASTTPARDSSSPVAALIGMAASCRFSSRRCAVTVMMFRPPRSSAVSPASLWSGVWVSAVWALAAWLMSISGSAVVARRRIGIWISRSVARFVRWASKRASSHSADNQSNFLFLLFWIDGVDDR